VILSQNHRDITPQRHGRTQKPQSNEPLKGSAENARGLVRALFAYIRFFGTNTAIAAIPHFTILYFDTGVDSSGHSITRMLAETSGT
jgi:hypothetical protein